MTGAMCVMQDPGRPTVLDTRLTVGHAPEQLHYAQHKKHVWWELLNGCLLDGGVCVKGINLQTSCSKAPSQQQQTPTTKS
jgi:hypothetical protein